MPSRAGILAVRSGLGLALILLASAQSARGRIAQYPEESLLCDVAVPRAGKPPLPAASLDDLCAALAACWRVPADLAGSEALEITVRFGLDGNGLIGVAPRPTYAAGVPNAEARASLVRGTIESIRRCTPVARTPAIPGAAASRDIALRLIYKRPEH